ncbi:MAG: hypothetical protein WDW38_007623 [Sanguina aurantia]
MQKQVVLLGCSLPDSNITAWDLRTGTNLTSYKPSSSSRNGLCCVGRDYLAAAQTNKDALHFFAHHKDQSVQRSFTVERTAALASSMDGTYLAAGGASGTIYLWEVGSGRLLRTWAAHYKAVSVLAFAEGGSVLVSGGDDTLVNVWLLADLLDVGLDPMSAEYSRPQPLHAWCEHTLPVTSLAVGLGEVNAVVATVSLDRTLQLHAMSDGRLLLNARLPCALHCVALDPGEHAVYAGGSDGCIYEVSLTGANGGSGSSSAHPQGASAGSGASLSELSGGSHVQRMEGHSRVVNSLAVSLDGELLVSGSDDGTARVWDLRSRQAVQVISAPGAAPVTSVLVMLQPLHLTVGSGGAPGGGRPGPKRPAPLAPLVKYTGMAGNLKAWQGTPIIVDGSVQIQHLSQTCGLGAPPTAPQHPSLPWGLALSAASSSAAASASLESSQQPGAQRPSSASEAEVAALRAEVAALKETSTEWQALHAELYARFVAVVQAPAV